MGLDDREVAEEPTPAEIADACKDVLPPEAYEAIAEMETTEEALGFAFTTLMDAGVENPQAYLIGAGILINFEL